ncbi:geranylgeranylglycerol-phosphate geranylgeranyltransferase [Psychroserpens luteolus]|uniref:geranylgeranylglycerol-phosphate geranylgeranyltransferase n=1 Tax=Psychroserpens luteolus TaxID=2855840 RepID=UPI0021D43451|nr:geranylgeranylglycerol-phosphate geranylgeranyltransferase [Psychroserpens luteolus]MCD2259661.1 geranylgeranylglycerol-phosphate geranylgeranyltransferase [Psychroserpens luteolus]
MQSILNLIRWQNLVMIIIAQMLIKYAFFEHFNALTALDTLHFIILVVATICIAAAGNIINDIYDVETDTINKPDKVLIGKHVSEKLAYNLFFALNIIGILLSLYLSHSVGKSSFFSIFVMISIALYMYASYLKGTVLFGNILISFLVAMSLLVVGIFDILPVMVPENKPLLSPFLDKLIDYAIFAFLINLIREIIKDIQDVDGDYKASMNTLPIVLGRDRATKIAFAVSMIPIGAVIYFVITYLYQYQVAIGYFLLCIIAPLIYATIKIFGAEHQQHYKHISTIYKLIMLFGILSLLLYPFIINLNGNA